MQRRRQIHFLSIFQQILMYIMYFIVSKMEIFTKFFWDRREITQRQKTARKSSIADQNRFASCLRKEAANRRFQIIFNTATSVVGR